MGVCSSAKHKSNQRRASDRQTNQSSNPRFQLLEAFYQSNKKDINKKLQVAYEAALAYRSHDNNELKLSFTSFAGQKLRHLTEILPFYLHIKKLNLWKCKLGPEGAAGLAPLISNLKGLIVLGMEENNLGDEGMTALAGGMTPLEHLTDIHVHINSFGDVGIKALAVSLTNKPDLELLNVGENQISPIGLRILLESLKTSNQALKTLNISANALGPGSADILLELLPKLPSLVKVYLTNNAFGEDDHEKLSSKLAQMGLFYLI